MFWNSLTVAVVFLPLLDFQPSAARLAIETTSHGAGNEYRIAEYNTKVTLTCNVDESELETAEDPTYTWKWFKGDNRSTQRITADFDRVYQIDVAENALTFNRFVGSNAGRYTCKLFDDNDAFVDAKVIYVALKPYLKLPKTATFNEGERMELECIVYGVPTPEISWKFENTTLVPSDRVSFLPDIITNISNAILILDPIAVENSGNFYCTGKSAVVAKPVVSDPCNVLVKETVRPAAAVMAQDPAEWLVAVDLAERRAVAAERRAVAAEQRAAAAERRAAVAEQRAAGAEQRAASAEQRATVAEKRATLAEQRVMMAEQRQKSEQLAADDRTTK